MGIVTRRTVITLSVLTGVVLELGIGALGGRREAWDSAQYRSVGLPLAAVVSLLLGYASRRRDWVWTVLLVPAQVTTMMVKSGEIGTLWPLAMALAGVLSLPFVAVAWLGARFRAQS